MKNKLFQIGKQIIAETNIDSVLTVAMDGLIEITDAERGMILLFEKKQIIFETVRNLNKEDIRNPKFEVSQTIINNVKKDGKGLCFLNALEETKFRNSDSIDRLKILSVICLPLKHEANLFGVIYLDNRTVMGVFEKEAYQLAEEFADFISLAAYNALERKHLLNHVSSLESELRSKFSFDSIIGHDPKMVEILKTVSKIANTDATVLITGESGTGKELIAHALHTHSSRNDKMFTPINCGALPENLLESEIFGHVKGAFTDASKDKQGWFEKADGGTIFLDEVSEMSPNLQVRLLRVLQSGEFSPVGTTELHYCDVRIVAATNQDLQQMVNEGKFREDLFYRLNVIDIELPPLRDRKSDIPLLCNHFLKMYVKENAKKKLTLSQSVEACLFSYDFPGNVRELENIMQRIVILAEGTMIESVHLPLKLQPDCQTADQEKNTSPFKKAKQQVVEKFERDYLINCIREADGNVSSAAQRSGIDRKNFYEKMNKYGINPQEYKNEKI